MKKFIALAGIVGGLALPGLAQTWSQYDRNGDGIVTFGELRSSGVRINNQIRALDRNGDRLLSRRELRNVQLNTGYSQPYYQTQTYGAYQQPYHWSTLDSNRNGVLESYELNQAGYQSNANYNMYNVDTNRDGYIDQWEARRAGYGTGNNTGSTILNLLQVLPGLIR